MNAMVATMEIPACEGNGSEAQEQDNEHENPSPVRLYPTRLVSYGRGFEVKTYHPRLSGGGLLLMGDPPPAFCAVAAGVAAVGELVVVDDVVGVGLTACVAGLPLHSP